MPAADRTLLFLCTGNYYRSRFAELLFNHEAALAGLPWCAGRALALSLGSRNVGPMSKAALQTLYSLGVAVPPSPRFPLQVEAEDFSRASLVVAVKEAEHRAFLRERFPAWENRVEYWHIHDVDCSLPEEALPELRGHVLNLVAQLGRAAGGSSRPSH